MVENVRYLCEYVGCKNREATGYSGGPRRQHPLCAEHLDPKWHPLDIIQNGSLHPDEPISAPCEHAHRATEHSDG